jgi:glycosyltransferase involved in cell wall biosynthesis
MTLSRRVPRSGAQRVVYQAAAEGLYYPLFVGRHARRARADVVHYPRHLVTPEVGLGVPAVVTLADVIALTNPELFSQVIVRHQRLVTPAAVRRAARVITHSADAKSEIVRVLGVEPERIAVVQHGVDSRFRPVEPDRGMLGRRFGIPGRYVLCVGTLEPRKNLARVVSAMRRIQPSFPDHRLVLTGGAGWKGDELDAMLEGDGGDFRVTTTGYVDDDELVQLYSGADCFVFPSLLEGFGLPVLEAMACGAPVVTSDRSSLQEVAGDAAVLVDPTSVDAVAAGIAQVLESEERAADLRRRGLERSKGFTWARAAEQTVAVYRDAAATIRR